MTDEQLIAALERPAYMRDERECRAAAQRIRELRDGYLRLIRDWEENDAAEEDEWNDGYEDALCAVAHFARATLAKGSSDGR